MSLLHWFARKKPPADAGASSTGLSRGEPSHHSRGDAAQVSTRRGERMARRELLYVVVRECMNRAGVLSSSYKFKVLSLDGWGRQFLVMADLAGEREEPAQRLAEIEAMIGHTARARHDILVKAVYWRQVKRAATPASPPPTLHEKVAPPIAKAAAAPQAQPPRSAGAEEPFEPINEQELAAFRTALAHGTRPPAAKAQRSYTLLTGFENTEMAEDPGSPRALSGTQYGDLR